MQGSHFLLIPETAAWWTTHFPTFTEHLVGRYQVVADEPGAGLLVDLRARRGRDQQWPYALSETLDHLASQGRTEPAVLDWTDLGLGSRLPGVNVFTPPPGPSLPYFDHTVDVVVLDDPVRLAEATRIATLAVVTVRGRRWPTVADVALVADGVPPPAVPVRFVVADPHPDPVWLAHLEELVEDERDADLVFGADVTAVAGGAEIVAVVEDGVLPLPGCCATVRRTFSSGDRVGAVAPRSAGDGSSGRPA